VLLDDDDHSYEYVMIMVQDLFGFGLEKAFAAARKVDAEGRVVCLTTHKEHAELKLEQILGYGADPRIMGCKGSMSAIIEPAEFEGDEDDDRSAE
jgi:ATP-dependent Clp protease adaptor protein ClpS